MMDVNRLITILIELTLPQKTPVLHVLPQQVAIVLFAFLSHNA